MVDWKKDIKLSDLLAKGRSDADADVDVDEAPEPAAEFVAPSGEAEAPDVDATESTPFWKREITFGRRSKDEADTELTEFDPADEPGEKRSYLKRELTFRRPKDEGSDADFDLPADTTEHSTPFWKREITFGRRKEDVAAGEPEYVFEESAHEEPEPMAAAPEPPEETVPFWKREIKFGRRHDDAATTDEALEHEEAAHEEPGTFGEAHESSEESTPFWKRELTFGGRKDDAAEEPVYDEAETFGAAHEDESSEGAKPFWKRELTFGRRKDDVTTPEPVFDEAVGDEPAVEDAEPAHEEPEPVAAVTELPEHEVATPELSEAAVAASELPEPVAATHEHDADLDEEATPFWKREIKFGRRRGDSLPQPRAGAPGPAHLDTGDVDADALPAAERKPFFKRELSFRRKKDPDFDAPTREQRRFFGLDFGRWKRDRDAGDAEFVVSGPEPEKRPFWKRELSFGRSKGAGDLTPGRSRGGRNKHVVGLKVGASQIAAARVVNNGSPELVQLARQSLEQGIIVGGELRDPDALAEALRDFFASHDLPNRNVRLGIGNNRIGVRSFEISGVHDPKQLENAVRFRAQEALPIPLDEAVLDYHVIDESVSPTGIRTYRVLLVVAYRELVDRYVAACRGAGLRLVGIDLEAFALLRALSPPPAEGFPDDTALVAVSIGHDRSTFAVSNGTVCEFTRVLDWGGSSLNTAIARTLDITPSQAEPVKRTLSLSQGEDATSAPADEQSARAEEAVRLELQTFARELVSSLHFYQNQPGSLAIGNITLTGGTAHLPGLAAELQRLIGVKVRVGDPLRRVKTAKRVETPEQVGSMAVAIGLGIED